MRLSNHSFSAQLEYLKDDTGSAFPQQHQLSSQKMTKAEYEKMSQLAADQAEMAEHINIIGDVPSGYEEDKNRFRADFEIFMYKKGNQAYIKDT